MKGYRFEKIAGEKKKRKKNRKKKKKIKERRLGSKFIYQIYRGRREYQIKQMNYRATKKKKLNKLVHGRIQKVHPKHWLDSCGQHNSISCKL